MYGETDKSTKLETSTSMKHIMNRHSLQTDFKDKNERDDNYKGPSSLKKVSEEVV